MTEQFHAHLFTAMWLAWALYWWIASRGAKETRRRESVSSRLMHMLPLLVALALLWADHVPGPLLSRQILPWAPWQFWCGAAIAATGLAFAVWARLHIGRNWSGTVTLKADHELIETGPYALVRHPIYTGLLVAIAGSALARDEWRGVLAIAIAWIALWRKLRLEERWLREQFGPSYRDYSHRVPALLPFFRQGDGNDAE